MAPLELLTNAYDRFFPFTSGTFAVFALAGMAIVITIRIVYPIPLTGKLRTATTALLLTIAYMLTGIGMVGLSLRLPDDTICVCTGTGYLR